LGNAYKPTKRSWIKLWVDEWLQGTTRFELSEKQRSIWIDLLAMAGKSRFPGVIASGKYDDGFRGYPLSYLTGSLVYTEEDFVDALKACEIYGKIILDKKIHDGIVDYVIHINNWEKYQSEYLRQKKYTDTPEDSTQLTLESDEIFKHWNICKIIHHDKCTDDMVKQVNKALREYNIEDVKKSISNYAVILKGDDYFWEYTWRLEEFLSRGISKFLDLELAKKNFKKKVIESIPLGKQKRAGVSDEHIEKLKKLGGE
jgi:hypothetical protein